MVSFANVVKTKMGDNVELPCSANGASPMKYTWKRMVHISTWGVMSSLEESINSSNGRMSMIGQNLVILSVKRQDVGPYVCRAENHLGRMERVVQLVLASGLYNSFFGLYLYHVTFCLFVLKGVSLASILV